MSNVLIRDFTENIMREIKKYLPHLNSNGVGRVEHKIESQLKKFAEYLPAKAALKEDEWVNKQVKQKT